MMGRKKITLRSDQEPAIKDLKSRFKQVSSVAGVAVEETLVGDSRAAGDIESAMEQVQGMVRTYELAIEAKIKGEIPEDHPLIEWIVRHAAAHLNRYQIGNDGMTAHRRLRGTSFKKEVVDIGESIWYLKPKTKGKHKLASRWKTAIWLGLRAGSGESIVGTSKARSVRTKGSEEERWNIVKFIEMKGSSWEPQPGVDSRDIYPKVKVRKEITDEARRGIPRFPEGVLVPTKKYRFRICKKDVDDHDPAEDCDRCSRTSTGDSQLPHTRTNADRDLK
jgi:hypothetical protein